MTATEKAIAELHAWFCERTGLRTKLCFSQSLWHDRLRDYRYDAAALRADADLIVRYLKREIAAKGQSGSGRNLGALKLVNFLQPDNFDADLAIAKMTKQKEAKVAKDETKLDCVGIESRADDQTRGKIAEELRTFRHSFGKGGLN